MTVTATTLALSVALVTVLMWRVGWLRRAPVVIHNLAWIAALLVIGSGLVHYTPLSLHGWALIAIGIAVFNAGAVLPILARGAITPRSHAGLPRARQESVALRPLMTRRRLYQLCAVYFAALAYYLQGLASRYGLATIIHDAASIRSYQDNYYLQGVPLPIRLCLYLGPLLFVVLLNPWAIRDRQLRAVRWALAVVIIATLSLQLQRTLVFVALLWEVGLLVVDPQLALGQRLALQRNARRATRKGRNRARVRIGLCVAGAVIAFQLIGAFVGKSSTTLDERAALDPKLQDSPWSSAMVYLSSGVPAFGRLVESTDHRNPPPGVVGSVIGDYNPQTWGRATFQAPLKLTGVAPAWDEVAPFTHVPFTTNVYTWLEPGYRDFREFGVVFLALALGLVTTWSFGRRSRSPQSLFACGLIVGLTAWAPFVNKYVSVFTLEYLVLLSVLGRNRPRQRRPARAFSRLVPASGPEPEFVEAT